MATRKNSKNTSSRKHGASQTGPVAPQGPRVIGKVRRGQVASTFGAGAVVDLRAPGSGAPLSGVVAGLEEWDKAAPSGRHGCLHAQVTHEPRLQKRLSVSGFRLPPVKEDEKTWVDVLPVVRFPGWLQCPRCSRLAHADGFESGGQRPERYCGRCSTPGNQVYAVPVRFIVACEDGHLDDFPWQRWIGCTCEKPQLKLRTAGAGLAGKSVRCDAAGCPSKEKSLEKVFAREALTPLGFKHCTGHRPWLPLAPEQCPKPPRVLQRGASTVYYPQIESALDIPPFSIDLSNVIGPYWDDLKDTAESDWPSFIRLNKLVEKTGKPLEVLLRMVGDWKRTLDSDPVEDPLEWAEYLQMIASEKAKVALGEFQTQPERVPPEVEGFLGSVVLAHRLREVRAHVGFTRIKPPGTSFRAQDRRPGRLSGQPLPWLPAVELRGEGIFLRFDTARLEAWEAIDAVKERAAGLAARRISRIDEKSITDPSQLEAMLAEEARKTSPRFLLIHSFAHALMRQLSLSCGYSNAALRERLYVGTGTREMAGVLIHTGSADSEGTLGGLVRQGREERLIGTLQEMLAAASWCSSDPLCITGAATLSSPDNLAACHACLLAPETSCQHFNLLLDRGMLVGTPEAPEVGFFHELLAEVL